MGVFLHAFQSSETLCEIICSGAGMRLKRWCTHSIMNTSFTSFLISLLISLLTSHLTAYLTPYLTPHLTPYLTPHLTLYLTLYLTPHLSPHLTPCSPARCYIAVCILLSLIIYCFHYSSHLGAMQTLEPHCTEACCGTELHADTNRYTAWKGAGRVWKPVICKNCWEGCSESVLLW